MTTLPDLRLEAGKLVPRPDWLDQPPVQAVAAALGPGNLRFVGGAVRDTFLGRPVIDIDAATPLSPETVIGRLRAAGIRSVPTGLDHGTVTAVAEGRHVEITTLRHDMETDGRHARVAFTADWEADAERRDFTVNALYMAPDGELFDPAGGLADLKARRLRFIGDPAARIAEDRLRLLRYFRFRAVLGDAERDEAALAAIRAALPGLEALSVERKRDELMKLLKEPAAPDVIALMAEEGVLAALDDGLSAVGSSWPALMAAERETGRTAPADVRLLALLGCDPVRVTAFLDRFRFSGAQARFAGQVLTALQWPHRARVEKWQEASYRYGTAVGVGAIWLDSDAGAGLAQRLDRCGNWQRPQFPVRASDLMAKGFAPGPALGQELARLEERWIDSGFLLGFQANS